MIGEAVLHAALAVGCVVLCGVSIFDRAVVHDDALPVAGSNADTRRLAARDAKPVAGGLLVARRDGKLLADAQEIAVQVVGLLEFADGDAIAQSNVAERVAFVDRMSGRGRCRIRRSCGGDGDLSF